ncbi:fas-binding factor 1 isoform X2 [Xenopus tropicalis]|uniref:Fas-binding factor 1 isoform X2 n=1 Tax=Xenopus tropicalis TaxID=8364 RepID=A0A8J0R7Z6_XENTR|nr:fas-binding factor 1 isoform X2 [Xenopus tropicalis]|eukprot:XP_004918510.1 PREDICTED: fas-binding factor 1 isoform X2 [Xenopus tropicalis]
MASRKKKGILDSIDDDLGDLLRDDEPSPIRARKASPINPAFPSKPHSRITSSAHKSSPLDDTFFSQLAKEAGEESDVSEADPQALLDAMKDMDELDAEIFGGRKLKSAPAKDSRMSRSAGLELKPQENPIENKRGHSAPESERKITSSPAARPYKKFSLEEDAQLSEAPLERTDLNDPLAGILSDEDDLVDKKIKPRGSTATEKPKSAPESAPTKSADNLPISPAKPSLTTLKKDEFNFGEETDDLMDALGFDNSPERTRVKESSAPPPARSKLDELLGRGTAAKLLERPPTGERKEFKLDPKYQKQQENQNTPDDADINFGSYQPTVNSPEGRPSRRPSVRFSADGSDNFKSEGRSRSSTPATRSPARGERGGADWLGLKDDDIDVPDFTPSLPVRDPPRSAGVTPSSAGRPTSGNKIADKPINQTRSGLQEAASVAQEDDGWLTSALSQKKAQKQEMEEKSKSQARQEDVTGSSPAVFSQTSSQESAVNKGTRETGMVVAEVSGSPKKVSTFVAPKQEETIQTAVTGPSQEHGTARTLQTVVSRPLERKARDGDRDLHGDPLQAQNRVMDLEAQVRKLQLERDQQNLLLETLRERHQEDMELIENAHRSRLKLVEDSARQREERLRLENQELSAQYLSRCQSTETEKAELLAQYQKKLTEFQQEKELELERIRELQRVFVQEMCRDHEEQLQRLKRLKDQEIDAVTSASSHTRSLNTVIEQMESFSHKLSDLSHRVESTQQTTSHELETGARQREGQLRALQEQLSRQQKDMEQERNSLRMVITNMETRLIEQSRLLEQERWRVTSEQAKVESLQRSLEEQRRVVTQQMAIEREELERAKSALLEEQQSVMSRCTEERRKLAAEWSDFHTQQKLSKERAEKEANRVIVAETQREGAIINLAKEQAELKIKASELLNKEEQLFLAREAMEKERQDLRLEKERVNASALRVRQRAEEIESMSKLASQRYEEGEKALEEACKIESEHQGRLRAIQQKLEILRQQEEHIHQERLSLAQQRRQLNQLQQELPTASVLFPARPPEPPLMAQNGKFTAKAIGIPAALQETSKPQVTEFHAKLALLKMSAQQDRDFLEEEQAFLETLRKPNLPWSQAV